jgi:hypothetical protein
VAAASPGSESGLPGYGAAQPAAPYMTMSRVTTFGAAFRSPVKLSGSAVDQPRVQARVCAIKFLEVRLRRSNRLARLRVLVPASASSSLARRAGYTLRS